MDLVAPAASDVSGRPLSGRSPAMTPESKPLELLKQPGPTSAWTTIPSALRSMPGGGQGRLGLPSAAPTSAAIVRRSSSVMPLVRQLRGGQGGRSPINSASCTRAMLEAGRVSWPPSAFEAGLPVPGPQRPDHRRHPHRLQGLLRRDRLRVAGCRAASARSAGLSANTFRALASRKSDSAWAAQPSIRRAVLAQILLPTAQGHKRALRGQQRQFPLQSRRSRRLQGPGQPDSPANSWAGSALQPRDLCN